ncbi:unnamed protein product, partial [Phaeothamnion confervicola]
SSSGTREPRLSVPFSCGAACLSVTEACRFRCLVFLRRVSLVAIFRKFSLVRGAVKGRIPNLASVSSPMSFSRMNCQQAIYSPFASPSRRCEIDRSTAVLSCFAALCAATSSGCCSV